LEKNKMGYGYWYEEYSEMGFDDLSNDDDYDDDIDYDEYQYQDYGYEAEDTWFYEWRGHYSYDKPTLFQKIAWVLMDAKDYLIFKMRGYEDIPF